MGRPVLFLIHGIGVQPAGWSESVITKLQECADRYPTMAGKNVRDEIDFVEIAYDDIFEDVLQRWNDEVANLKTNAMFPQADDAVGWLSDSTSGSFVWNHVGDVVLFLTSQVRAAVVSRVVAKMAATIADKNDGATTFNILAHSLGTAVTMEAVNDLVTPNAEIGWDGLPPGLMFEHVFMAANTSRLLQRDGRKAYTESRLLPKSVKPDGICVNYHTYYHSVDPFPLVRRFDLQAAGAEGYFSHKIDHYYEPNIHGYSHYLEHPILHGLILRIPDTDNLPFGDLHAAVMEYHDMNGKKFGGKFERVQQVVEFKDMLSSITRPDLEDKTKLVDQLKYIVSALREML